MIYRIKILSVLLFILAFSKIAFAMGEGSDNFIVFNNRYTLMPYYTMSKLKVNITGKYDLFYRPDKGSDIGLYVAYKNIGFGIGLGAFDALRGEESSRVKYYDFRLNYYGRSIVVDGIFQYYKSFAVEETTKAIPDSVVSPNRPDQKLVSVGFNIYYNFNTAHSLKAVFRHSERQLKSNGAFLLGLSQTYTLLQADDSYFPQSVLLQYDFVDYGRLARLLSVIPIVGYQYTFVYKNYYFSPLLLIGAGAQFQKYSYKNDKIYKDTELVRKMVINIPIGYNGDKLFYGLIFKNDVSKSNIHGSTLNFSMLSLSLFIGIRFW